MAARMVKCHKPNNNKLLFNTCRLEMKSKKPLHLVFIQLRTALQHTMTFFVTSKWPKILNGQG